MRQIAQADGHDGPRLSLELVPGIATVIDHVRVVAEHAVGQPVVSHELPTFSRGFNSGHFGGSGIMVILGGTTSL
jgi:hypothetical protein